VLINRGTAVLIDGGGNFADIGRNTGVRVVMPYLDYLGINICEAAFISHSHDDHALGIIELMGAGRLKRLYLPEAGRGGSETYSNIINAARKGGTEIVYISKGDVINIGGFVIECLHPTSGSVAGINDLSAVLRVSFGDSSVLFTGDIEAAAERILTDNGTDISADILKVPHHGSRSSSTEGFLAAVNPLIAVAGVSERNVHGHPHPSVVGRYADMGIPLYTTADRGAVIFTARKGGFEYYTMGDRIGRRR
jgi:competence protein ComEC